MSANLLKINIAGLVASFLFSLSAAHVFGQTNASPFDLMRSVSLEKRYQATEFLEKERQETIKNLILILSGNFSPDVKDFSAKLLGDYRASEAVDILVQNFELDLRPRSILGLLADDYIQPATWALIKIGNPSIPAVIRNLEETDNARIRGLSLKVLYQIDGDKDIVQLRLQKALTAQSDPQKKDRLKAALQALLDPKSGK